NVPTRAPGRTSLRLTITRNRVKAKRVVTPSGRREQMPFVKGQSGNPAGRPRGACNRATLALEAKLEARAEEVVGLLIEQALAGQSAAMRTCVDRLLPRGRERPVPLELPMICTGADVQRAVAQINAAVSAGTVTPREGLDLIAVVERSFRL